ncbi:MAG: family 78 glycoside hydrolase catalytic domain [Armatimonadetes bacterium]|nr:family 78 glycoside hydrolase catalytic domain [Armatimonadota bacterium]
MLLAAFGLSMPQPTLSPYALRCQNLDQADAVQTASPVFSWKLRATREGLQDLSQSGYQVVVATSKKALEQGDLWDSGRVDSSQTYGVTFQGKPLRSGQRVWWKVRSWDQAGTMSAWSAPAEFGVGLLNKSDWSAQWIHGGKPQAVTDLLAESHWIWYPVPDLSHAPAGSHTFTQSFTVAAGGRATVFVTADNLFSFRLNGKEVIRSTDPEAWSQVKEADLTPYLIPGKNQIEVVATNATEGYAGLIAAIEVSDPAGSRIFHTDGSWLSDGQPAMVIGKNGVSPWNTIRKVQFVTAPAQYFRKPIQVAGKVARATAYVTALGIVDFEVNGQRVSEDLFTPGWTDYRIRTYYRAFDITRLVKSGKNELRAVLGQGWFAGYVGWAAQREHYGDTPMLKAQIEIEYADGRRETVATDESWEFSDGPIRDEHFLHGEKYDARVAPSHWKPALVGQWEASLEAFPGNPVRAYQVRTPKTVRALGGGRYLIDFGQNLSEYCRIQVQEPAGTVVALRHGERLDTQGNLYTQNLRLAQAVDTYTCRGGGVEVWNPRFTFHGFQYVEVSGLSTAPGPDTVQAVAISSATPETGSMETSDPMLNQLLSNCWWTQKMNFVDIPTDCPQRDERLGWTGDAQAYIQTAAYFSDVQAFFDKWLVTLDDAQGADGNYPKVAPVISHLDDGGPAWADAGVICPMEVYETYGDIALLRRHYPNMKRFVDFCEKRSKPDLLPPDKYHIYGDWLSINADTPNDVITTAYFAGSAGLVSRAAEALGNSGDAKKYRDLRDRVAAAFRNAFVLPDGKVKGDTQCGYVLALGFDLLTPGQAKAATERLVENIKSRGWHLSTGFVGTRDLMHVLTKIGRSDVAFRLLHNTSFPSWGFEIQHGATSIWERWDGWTPERGFQDVGMNSFAHYAYGAVAGWMFKTVGGISPLEPGYGKILIEPHIDPNLTFAKTRFESIRGPIVCEWIGTPAKGRLTVEIPPNAKATVRSPDGRVFEIGSGRRTIAYGF